MRLAAPWAPLPLALVACETASDHESALLTVWQHGDSLVIEAAGEIDQQNVAELDHALSWAAEEQPRSAVVDLSRVWFLSCAALGALVAAYTRAPNPAWLRVVATGRATLRPLRLTGLDQSLAVYDSVATALGTVAGRP
ncbi:anti-anti-sigma factor [Amycolatopsis saalfeldensis]|uniref:Anti-sigma factor antagonist n=2 Tax=Amycolatopsis saalfeldensis TaxID=394193 RepID=A0A1H8YLS2_9PSEU|nr:anti-anti-sigma factor [Amycolatopsis saalfeldensis]